MSIAKYVSSLAASCIVVLFASEAGAQEKGAEQTVLGKRGTVVLDKLIGLSFGVTPGFGSGELGSIFQAGFLDFTHGTATRAGVTSTATTLGVRPSLDVFVTPNLTLGGELGFAHQWRSEPFAGEAGQPEVTDRTYALSALARIGYYLPLNDTIAFWPRLAGGGSYAVRESGAPETVLVPPSTSTAAFRANLDLDLAVPITKHLALLAGPRLSVNVSGAAGSDSSAAQVAASFRGSLSYAF